MRNCVLLLLAGVIMALPMLGQDSSSGAIQGTVFDPANRRVPGAMIVLVNNSNGFRFEHFSDSGGGFEFQLLPPG